MSTVHADHTARQQTKRKTISNSLTTIIPRSSPASETDMQHRRCSQGKIYFPCRFCTYQTAETSCMHHLLLEQLPSCQRSCQWASHAQKQYTHNTVQHIHAYPSYAFQSIPFLLSGASGVTAYSTTVTVYVFLWSIRTRRPLAEDLYHMPAMCLVLKRGRAGSKDSSAHACRRDHL